MSEAVNFHPVVSTPDSDQIALENRVMEYASSLDTPWRRVQLGIKRCLDVILAAVGLIVLSVPLFLLMLLIRLESAGAAVFTQRRLGRGGRVFKLYKLRSMQAGCEVKLNPDGSTRVLDGDPRVTRLGKLMRTFGLDELPQLVNVIKGDMSLIGPRPDEDFHLALYQEGDYRKLAMRPGITSLGQVSGRNAIAWKLRTRFTKLSM